DILREQALQDAIRHLAQPRAAPDTSRADQANACRQHAQGDSGAVPEDNGGVADNESEGEEEVPRPRPRRRGPGLRKRRRVATPEPEGAGTAGNPRDNGDSDEDDDVPTRPSPPQPRPIPQWDQTVPCTVSAGRKSRPTLRVQMAQYIRKTLQILLKRPTRTSPLPPLPPDDVRYPTLSNYCIRFDESETSWFNQLAANIAALQVRRDFPGRLPKSLADDTLEMVTSHIRYLSRCYKASLKADADELRAARLKRASANSRAHTLFASRLKIIDRFPNSLGKHRALIVHLGIEGTSSDEEEPGPPEQRSYLVRQRIELSSKVKTLKNKLDLAYNLYYKSLGSKGSQMHRRRPSDQPSGRPFMIEGLPITSVSRRWLQTLSKPEREFYEFVPHKYDYSFPDELLRRQEMPIEMEVDGTEDEDEDESEDGDGNSGDAAGEGGTGDGGGGAGAGEGEYCRETNGDEGAHDEGGDGDDAGTWGDEDMYDGAGGEAAEALYQESLYGEEEL
ncbi:hypothetical protein FRC06_006906, partial [Ceratobasidium sp. 370]